MPLLADLDPPAHGLVKLRARLARRRGRQALWAGLVLGPAAATAVVVGMLAQAPAPARFDHPALVEHAQGIEVVVDGRRIPALELSEGLWLVP